MKENILGIYKIRNIKNNDFYIGSSKNINKRWSQHKYRLKNNIHHSIILQRSWNKYGENCFIIEIIERCEFNQLFEKEQFYLDTLKPKYNIGLTACGGDNLTNNPNRKSIIEKITKSINDRYSKMTEEEKCQHSENLKGSKNPNFENKWTNEMKENASEKKKFFYKTNSPINKGKKLEDVIGEEKSEKVKKILSENAAKRIGDKNGFFGKKHKKETKEKLKNLRLGKYFGQQNIEIIINDKVYKSLGEASKELDIPITTIRWRIKSKNKKFDKYQYKDL